MRRFMKMFAMESEQLPRWRRARVNASRDIDTAVFPPWHLFPLSLQLSWIQDGSASMHSRPEEGCRSFTMLSYISTVVLGPEENRNPGGYSRPRSSNIIMLS